MECFICGKEVEVPAAGWESLTNGPANELLCCGKECDAVARRYSARPTVTSSLSIDAERASLEAADETTADAYRWRLSSAVALAFPFVRIRHQPNSKSIYLVASQHVAVGTALLNEGDELMKFVTSACTPTAVVVGGHLVAARVLSAGTPITVLPSATPLYAVPLSSAFGCSLRGCECQTRSYSRARALPCPLSPVCHGGRCLFNMQRNVWECLVCHSFWSTTQFASCLCAENRCKEAFAEAAGQLYSDSSHDPSAPAVKQLTKHTYEAIKRCLSVISDAGIGPDHVLYTLMCQLFVDYFLALAKSMRGSGTQQAAAGLATQWVKVLLKSCMLQQSFTSFGWYIGAVIARVADFSLRFPSLHTETIHLIRFLPSSGFYQIHAGRSPNATLVKDLQVAASRSKLALTYAVCDQWLCSSPEEPSDLQRAWEDYLMSVTSKAIQGGSQLPLNRILGARNQ